MLLVVSSIFTYGLNSLMAMYLKETYFAFASMFLLITSVLYHSNKSSKTAYWIDQVAIYVYGFHALYESYFVDTIPFLMAISEILMSYFLHSFNHNITHIMIHITSAMTHTFIMVSKVYLK
jgi:hypothetical protein